MRKLLILMALAILTASTTGCSNRCRNLFRRGAPCGGTTLATPSMLGGAIPLGPPLRLQRAVPQGTVIPGIMTQPECCYEKGVPICDPCDPCQAGYIYGTSGYISDDGGYIESDATSQGAAGTGMQSGFGGFPGPLNKK